MSATNYFCRHFRGMHMDLPCKAGVDPMQYRDATRPATYPCYTVERHGECKSFEGYTQAEIDEEERFIAGFLVKLAALTGGKGERCIHCDEPIEKLEQVGRCVYARPCNCRQYQGRLPKRDKA